MPLGHTIPDTLRRKLLAQFREVAAEDQRYWKALQTVMVSVGERNKRGEGGVASTRARGRACRRESQGAVCTLIPSSTSRGRTR